MSEAVERKIVALLGTPTTSPYGNPIPGLEELGVDARMPEPETGLVRVDEVARRGGGKVEVRRIAEHVQLDPTVMNDLKAVGLRPGSIVDVASAHPREEMIEIIGGGTQVRVNADIAHAVFAQPR